jgi:hypothetical protein
MPDVMMGLGAFRFSLSTAAYQRLQRTDTYRWVFQDRFGRDAAAQFCGPGKRSITLEGTIYPRFRGGLEQIDAMRAEAAKGKALLLVDGLGHVWGKWVIEEVAETATRFFAKGVPLKQEFRLQLAFYGEDSNAVSNQ